MKRTILLAAAWGMLIVGLIISIYFVISTYVDGYWIYGGKTEYEITGQFGDFFGGVVGTVFALAGTLLVVLTFMEQAKQNKRESFETKFYEMLHLHKQNTDEIRLEDVRGREAIEKLFFNLRDIYDMVEGAILTIEGTHPPANDKAEVERFDQMRRYLSNSDNRLNLIHNLSYGYFFYGFKDYYITKNEQDIQYKINVDVTAILVIAKAHKSLLTPRNSLLGHYYRHLYQTIQFIAKSKFTESDKYNYAKIVRAQLSDYEQVLLYYNSLSVMGRKWITPIGETKFEKMCLIARFRLIKNIPYYLKYFGRLPANLFQVEKNAWERIGKQFFEMELPN
jgi:hypothetical protein